MMEIEPMAKPCTDYAIYDCPEDMTMPCKCPACGGFLVWDETGQIPICHRCGTELAIIPELDEETREEQEWGKICIIGEVKKPNPNPRQYKKERKKWRSWL